jgi:hypothetical protein
METWDTNLLLIYLTLTTVQGRVELIYEVVRVVAGWRSYSGVV